MTDVLKKVNVSTKEIQYKSTQVNEGSWNTFWGLNGSNAKKRKVHNDSLVAQKVDFPASSIQKELNEQVRADLIH